jgi:hypothetical protein
LENYQKKLSRKLNPDPTLKKPDDFYAETPTEKADGFAAHLATTFTPNTNPHLPQFTATVHDAFSKFLLNFTPL